MLGKYHKPNQAGAPRTRRAQTVVFIPVFFPKIIGGIDKAGHVTNAQRVASLRRSSSPPPVIPKPLMEEERRGRMMETARQEAAVGKEAARRGRSGGIFTRVRPDLRRLES